VFYLGIKSKYMGCSSSSAQDESEEERVKGDTLWRYKLSKKESKKAYIKDGTLPKTADESLLMLRVYLEDPSLLEKFAVVAKQRGKLGLLLCWVEVLEYKVITAQSLNMKLSKANNLYHKYVKEDAVLMFECTQMHITSELREKIHGAIVETEIRHTKELPADLFDSFGFIILQCIHDELFTQYRKSTMFVKSVEEANQNTNTVQLEDFVFYEKLGQGSFGMVVHCKKKSTGKHFAMKIQSKVGLFKCFSDVPHRVVFEKEALAKCHHPFIVSMDYAFQTETLALMVMDLGTGSSLATAGTISEERAAFYTAEIVLALDHIHQMGMIYRDLKPANVLLNADGHIQLVDLGGVVDVGGKTLGYHNNGAVEDCMFDDCGDDFSPESAGSLQGQSRKFSLATAIPDSILDGALASLGLGKGKAKRAPSYNPGSYSAPQSVTAGKYQAGELSATPVQSSAKHSFAEPPSLKRATSIMGTAGYMAPEVSQAKNHELCIVVALLCESGGRCFSVCSLCSASVLCF
jgi:hypothetical protein